MDDLIKDPPPPGAAKALQDIIEGDDIWVRHRLRHRGGDDGVASGLGFGFADDEHGVLLPFSQVPTFHTGLCEKLIYIPYLLPKVNSLR